MVNPLIGDLPLGTPSLMIVPDQPDSPGIAFLDARPRETGFLRTASECRRPLDNLSRGSIQALPDTAKVRNMRSYHTAAKIFEKFIEMTGLERRP